MRKKPSLKLNIVIIIALWVVLFVIVIGIIGNFVNANITNQLMKNTESSVKYTVKASVERIASAVDDCREASYYPNLKDAINNYIENESPKALYDSTNLFLSQFYKYNRNFLSTIVFYTDFPDIPYYTINERYTNSVDLVSEYNEKLKNIALSLSPKIDTGIEFARIGEKIYIIRNLIDAESGFKVFGMIMQELNIPYIFEDVLGLSWTTGVTFWINNTEISLIGDISDLSEHISEISTYTDEIIRNQDSTAMLSRKKYNGYDVGYFIGINYNALNKQIKEFQFLIGVVAVSMIPVLILAFWFLYNSIARPVGVLLKATEKIEDGELGYQIESKFNNREMYYLANSFNDMSAKLQSQFNRIYSEELALRDAKIMALQAQINPHFLNNTLEIINWEARLAGNIQVSKMIEALSTMLDAAMNRRGSHTVQISEELSYVDAYLYIIKERFGDRIKITKKIDKSCLIYYVPRLILQPVIENAVEHGIEPGEKGEITIKIYRTSQNLVMEIINTGKLTEEQKAKLNSLLDKNCDIKSLDSTSLGLYNTNQRLGILYGKNSCLSVKFDNKNEVVAQIIIDICELEQ